MKKLLVFLFVTLLVFGVAGGANALPFSNIVDWDDCVKRDRTAIRMFDNPGLFTITHNVFFGPNPVSITDLTLTISHLGNKANGGEVWLVSDSGEFFVGQLEQSRRKWVDQEFSLPSSLYEGIISGVWSIEFNLSERTRGKDNIWIDKTMLSGNYQSIPEPATMLLFGAGLAGLAIFRKKSKK